ncbi:zinc finger protein 22-like [Syngnathoides biaculeatus]|uniref:zinc finger protein 22-like n=1 Tax=Syngnathoides biaculeatus TaxID=300417 RepID=UPI002ADD4F94|nr:zinc finger protein 22-like [Syngnathoides biaculeatus]
MCKVEMLKALLNQRLSAAVEEIFGVFARTIAEYEEELCRTKEENERQRHLLDAVFRPQADTLGPDVSEEEHREWSFKVERREPEAPHIKEEAEEAHIAESPLTAVPFEREDDEGERSPRLRRQRQRSRWPQPPSRRVATEGDGDQTESLLTRLSDSDQRASRHADNTHWKCSQCDKAFGSKYTLTRHMKSHTVGKEHWKCSQCGRTLGDRRNLRRHMMVHTGEKPFMCAICGKRFSQKANLITHTRTHTGEKPFSCSLCSKRFGDRSALIQHKKTHAGGKRFAYAAYNQSCHVHSNLGQHVRTNSGQKPSA